MGVVDAVEDLEKAKNKLDDLKFEAEETKKWDLAEALDEYIDSIQSIIDSITDNGCFVSKPVESEEIVCDHAETCTQRLVVCGHKKPHDVEILNTELQCTDNGYCSVAEINCRCVKVK